MSTLYVTEPGARIEKEYHQLLVTKDDEVLARMPLSRVSHVVLVGNVGATTPALLALLQAGVGLSLVSTGGELRGRLLPATGGNAPLRRAQHVAAADAGFCTAFARAVTCGKLRNHRTLLLRLRRRGVVVDDSLAPSFTQPLARVEAALGQAEQATSLDTLRGLEGSGARAYFAVLRQALHGELAVSFAKRARRPPPDPINALLSLGYTLLGEAMMTALEVVGLDPYVGFFHGDKYNQPSLALDLIEEFRTPIVDSLVLTLVNKRMLGPADFEQVDRDEPADAPRAARHAQPAIHLTRNGLRVFFREFADRLETEASHPVAGRRLSYRKIFEVQARLAAKTITGEVPAYQPFVWR